MAGKYGSSSVTISYDDGPGGTLRTITGAVLEMSGVKITSGMQDNTSYGDTYKKMLPVGVSEIAQMTLRGFWDTTATTGSHVIFGTPDTSPQASTRTLTVVFGDGKTWSSEGFLVSYEVLGKVNGLTEFVAVLQQNSGSWS